MVVARLRAAGALILGTTNCPEFLMAYETDNLLHGRTTQSLGSRALARRLERRRIGGDCRRHVGGGTRAATAADRCACPRTSPASARSSRRRDAFPARGHLPPCVGPFSILGAIGPMARTMADVHVAVSHARAARTCTTRSARRIALREPTLDELRSHTIGFFEDDGLVPVTAETRAAVHAAAAGIARSRISRRALSPATLEQLRKLWWKFFVQCGAMFYEPAIAASGTS